MAVSGYRAMWVMVMFDLPVTTAQQRKDATGFRKRLLDDGFWMMQYSVYLRPCPTDENAAVHLARVRAAVPAEGGVRVLKITDKQFGRMECYTGRIQVPAERMPRQLELF